MSTSLPTQKKLISVSQAAKFLGVSIDTVRRWDNSGVLHSERPDGKNRYFSQSELEEHKSGKPLPISEAAKELGISPTTLRRLESRGLLKPDRNNAGERVYDKDSLNNFLNSDYFLRKKQVKEKISESFPEEKDFSQDRITPKKPQDIETKNPIVDNNPPSRSSEEIFSNSNHQSSHRMLEVITVVVIFALLSAIGATNITLSEIRTIQSSKSPAVLSETVTYEEPAEASISAEPKATETEVPTAEPTAEPVTLQSIQSLLDEAADYNSKEASEAAEEKTKEEGSGPNLNDFKITLAIRTKGAEFINIREKASTESGQIAKAKEGDTFEMVSRESDWYEIKLNEKSNGFISEEFAQIKEIN